MNIGMRDRIAEKALVFPWCVALVWFMAPPGVTPELLDRNSDWVLLHIPTSPQKIMNIRQNIVWFLNHVFQYDVFCSSVRKSEAHLGPLSHEGLNLLLFSNFLSMPEVWDIVLMGDKDFFINFLLFGFSFKHLLQTVEINDGCGHLEIFTTSLDVILSNKLQWPSLAWVSPQVFWGPSYVKMPQYE